MMAQQQQPTPPTQSHQQQYFAPPGISPNHSEFHGFHYPIEASGSNSLGMPQMNGLHHNQYDDPHAESIPNIYEQAESENGYSDLTLLSDPTHAIPMESLLHNQFVALGLHSPTQPPQTDYVPYAPPPVNGTSVADQQQYSPPQQPTQQQRTSPTPLNLANLPPYLSPNHSPNHSGLSPSSDQLGLTPDSDNWEDSSQLSFDGTSSPPDGLFNGGAPLRRSVSASSAHSGSGGGKSYRRNIEKKSRDKKTTAYMRLKKELEDISHKNYGQRCQAEVLDGAAALLAAKAEENRRLLLENQVYREKLKQYGLWQTD